MASNHAPSCNSYWRTNFKHITKHTKLDLKTILLFNLDSTKLLSLLLAALQWGTRYPPKSECKTDKNSGTACLVLALAGVVLALAGVTAV